ncbi:ParA family protein [Pseudoduganella sp. S-14]|uniref:ParA family protein n=1 Tax=Pseudoduganella sp. S-14 TaxID=3404065 RepID=UPI003CFA76DF
MSNLDYILKRHAAVLDGGRFPKPEHEYSRYAVSIFRGGIGKTTLAFNLAYEMSRHDSILVADVCPQRNLSELLLGEDLQTEGPDIYDALMPYVAAGMDVVEPGELGMRISQSCSSFRGGKKSFAIKGSNSLFLFASSLYGGLNQLSVMDPARRSQAMGKILMGLRTVLENEADAVGASKTLIDTSPFFGGATHLAWMAADALVVPIRVDQSSLEAFDLTLRMLEDKSMDFLRYAGESGLKQAVPKIHVIAMTHCGWSRTQANTPDQSTQAFVQQVINKIKTKQHLFTSSNPLDSIVLLDDFHSAGRISGSTRTPLATLDVGRFVTIEGKRLQVNESLTRYQNELKFLANLL